MNERIRKLKEQATHVAMWFGDPDAGELNVELFAELIVRECINAVYDDGQDAEYYQNRIAKRFGVTDATN
jgi:hypothetical protein